MSQGIVRCAGCDADVDSATIIRVNVSGTTNNVTLYLCSDCEQAMPKAEGGLIAMIAAALTGRLKKLIAGSAS